MVLNVTSILMPESSFQDGTLQLYLTTMIRQNILSRLVLLLLLTSSVVAQSGRRSINTKTEGEDSTLVKVKTSEVLLTVTVKNQYGRLATGLTQRDFIVIENGQRQEITSFNIGEVPINVVLLLDASGSVFSEMKEIRAAAVKFVEQLRPQDRVSVIQFAEKVELIQNWTSNISDLKHAINWRYRPGESTNLWDAIYLAAEDKLSQVEGRKAIVILTDCYDTHSKVTREQAYWSAIRSGTSIYVVSKAQALANSIRKDYGGFSGAIAGTRSQAQAVIDHLISAEQSMSQLAQKTGGALFAPVSSTELAQAYLQIADELKNQYLITYTPNSDSRDGTFRTIKVLLTRPGLVVNHKEGYFATREL